MITYNTQYNVNITQIVTTVLSLGNNDKNYSLYFHIFIKYFQTMHDWPHGYRGHQCGVLTVCDL